MFMSKRQRAPNGAQSCKSATFSFTSLQEVDIGPSAGTNTPCATAETKLDSGRDVVDFHTFQALWTSQVHLFVKMSNDPNELDARPDNHDCLIRGRLQNGRASVTFSFPVLPTRRKRAGLKHGHVSAVGTKRVAERMAERKR